MLYAVFVGAQVAPRQRDDHLLLLTGNVWAARLNGIDPVVGTSEYCRRLNVPDKIVCVTLKRITLDCSIEIRDYVVHLGSTIGRSD